MREVEECHRRKRKELARELGFTLELLDELDPMGATLRNWMKLQMLIRKEDQESLTTVKKKKMKKILAYELKLVHSCW